MYDLRVVAANVHAGGVNMAADAAFEFHRLFSDSDGDGDSDSDNSDLFRLRAPYGSKLGDAKYVWWWDYDADGDVDASDSFRVKARRAIEYKGY